MKNLFRSVIVLPMLAAGAAQAGTITVTSIGNVPTTNAWYRANVASSATAVINTSQPRSGNGSVDMNMNSGSGKVDLVYTWGFVAGRTLGNLDALSYDWLRVSGTSTAHFQPALRLFYDQDGLASTTGDRGYLIWEQIYNGASTPTGSWVASDILGGNFWQRQHTPGNTVDDYDQSLAEWAAGEIPSESPYDLLSASTAILGIEVGIGSGWSGSFRGNVDNIRFGFAGAEATTFNFEVAGVAVPEPGSLALLGLGIFGLAAGRRRKHA